MGGRRKKFNLSHLVKVTEKNICEFRLAMKLINHFMDFFFLKTAMDWKYGDDKI